MTQMHTVLVFGQDYGGYGTALGVRPYVPYRDMLAASLSPTCDLFMFAISNKP
jgi:hypothetical protein